MAEGEVDLWSVQGRPLLFPEAWAQALDAPCRPAGDAGCAQGRGIALGVPSAGQSLRDVTVSCGQPTLPAAGCGAAGCCGRGGGLTAAPQPSSFTGREVKEIMDKVLCAVPCAELAFKTCSFFLPLNFLTASGNGFWSLSKSAFWEERTFNSNSHADFSSL